MKKVYYGIVGATLLSFATSNAQQLPNVGFADWKEACGETQAILPKNMFSTTFEESMRQRPGIEPASWNGSSVNQKVGIEVQEILVEKAQDSNDAVLTTKTVGVEGVASSPAPAFLTLGTPWVSAMTNLSECDGGVYGGVNFKFTPDALTLDVNRTDDNDESSYVIAYLWKGTFRSKIGKKSDPTFTHNDVDRAILGKVNAGQKGTLIASLEHTFTKTDGKQTLTIPFKYDSDATPEKMNVIVCCGNYWDRGSLNENTSVTTNNIRFVYYSTLSELSVNGTPVEGFSPDVYNYTIDEFMPANEAVFGFTAPGRSAKVTSNFDTVNHTVSFTVTNDGEDIDGLKEHTYTIKFAKTDSKEYTGLLHILLGGSDLTDGGQEAKVFIENTGNGVCTFSLPDFKLDLGDDEPVSLGDIVVPNVAVTTADGVTNYAGHVDDMKLANGEITANVDIKGTISENGVVDMTITVGWNNNGTIIPIDVTFSNIKTQELSGKLFIEMFDSYLDEDGQNASVEISQLYGTETCTFTLPDFSLDLGNGPMPLGDIVVTDVTISEAEGMTTYKGHVNDMKLLEGAITADVDLNGTVNEKGIAMMTINVNWKQDENNIIPIKVIFTNDPLFSAISLVKADENAITADAEYYTVSGMRVNSENLVPGIYVCRKGNTVTKILIK